IWLVVTRNQYDQTAQTLRRSSATGNLFFFFQAGDGIRGFHVTGVQTCALPISPQPGHGLSAGRWPNSRRPSGLRMMPAATSRKGLDMTRRPVACELPGDAPGTRSALKRPLERFGARGFDRFGATAHLTQPVVHDIQVVVLLEGVERQPDAETLGKGDLLFDGLAGMDLAVGLVTSAQVLAHVLRHEVAAIRGRVDQYVLAGRTH